MIGGLEPSEVQIARQILLPGGSITVFAVQIIGGLFTELDYRLLLGSSPLLATRCLIA